MGRDHPLATEAEIRLGSLFSEETEAMRLLVQGRVEVKAVGAFGVRAFVRDAGEQLHVVAFDGLRWSCTCPAVSDKCSHLLAVRCVVIAGKPHREERGTPRGGTKVSTEPKVIVVEPASRSDNSGSPADAGGEAL